MACTHNHTLVLKVPTWTLEKLGVHCPAQGRSKDQTANLRVVGGPFYPWVTVKREGEINESTEDMAIVQEQYKVNICLNQVVIISVSVHTATTSMWWLLQWIQTLQKFAESFPSLLHVWYLSILPAVERGLLYLQRVGKTQKCRDKGTVGYFSVLKLAKNFNLVKF